MVSDSFYSKKKEVWIIMRVGSGEKDIDKRTEENSINNIFFFKCDKQIYL